MARLYITDPKKSVATKIYLTIYYLIRLSIIGALTYAIYEQRWMAVFISSIILVLTFFPLFIEKRYKIEIPLEFEIIIVSFIYASLFLGEVGDFYARFWWWDIALHGLSAIALGFIGFVILYILFDNENNTFKASPIYIAIFTFAFAMAIGGVWEIFEFSMDQAFGFNMQNTGLVDTMGDLIVDCIGGIIAAAVGYAYLKGGEVFFLGSFMKTFKKENKRLFS